MLGPLGYIVLVCTPDIEETLVTTPIPGDRKWTPVTITNAGLGLLLEIALLVALGYWGFSTGEGWLVKVLLGIGAPVGAGVVWGLFLAAGGPKFSLPTPVRVVLKLVVFGVGALALYATGHPVLGLVFAVLSVITVVVENLAKPPIGKERH